MQQSVQQHICDGKEVVVITLLDGWRHLYMHHHTGYSSATKKTEIDLLPYLSVLLPPADILGDAKQQFYLSNGVMVGIRNTHRQPMVLALTPNRNSRRLLFT